MAGQSKEASIPPWGLAIAGASGALLANALVYPLDMYGYIPNSGNDVSLTDRAE